METAEAGLLGFLSQESEDPFPFLSSGLVSYALAAVCGGAVWLDGLLAAWLGLGLSAVVLLAALAGLAFHSRGFLLGSRTITDPLPTPDEIKAGWAAAAKVAPTLTLRTGNPGEIACYDPATGCLLGEGTAHAMDKGEVEAVVARARAAQAAWKTTTFEERREVLRVMLDYVVEYQEEICRIASRDSGKTLVDGAFGEVLTTCEKLRWTIANGEGVLQPESRAASPMMMYKAARVEYVPLGVMAAIVSWNYPFHNMYGQIISALFAGNAMVMKVSEHVCWSSRFYADLMQKILVRCGHSPDLVQIVYGYGEAGAALVNAGVDKLIFIGSPEVGKLVMKAASDTLTPVLLELGGKDAAVVLDDCDFEQVIGLGLRGTFQNCGQNCVGLERLIVHAAIYDKLVAEMKARIEKLSQGPPLDGEYDCGAMTMGQQQAEKIEATIADAVKQGARVLVGGKVNKAVGTAGWFVQPTLLVDVTKDMYIAQHEVFGPVMTVMKAKDDAEAIAIANACDYGLGSNVFSLNYQRAERIAAALETGMCNINDFAVNYLCQSLPFGGVKISGFDRFAGIEGLRGCCAVRAITSDKVSGIRTSIPPPLAYPIKASGFEFVKALINLFYGNSLLKRLKACVDLALIGIKEKKD